MTDVRNSQVFLESESFTERFTSYVSRLSPLVEIGCGDGRISKRINPDICVEIDQSFIQYLKDYNPVISDARYLPVSRGEVVASLPYYITHDFFMEMSSLGFVRAVMILQKDFVDKITNYTNSISLILNYYFRIETKEVIPPEAFRPVPRVFSAISIFTRKENYNQGVTRTLECIGRYRNKTLRKASMLCNKRSNCEKHIREFKPWEADHLLSLIE